MGTEAVFFFSSLTMFAAGFFSVVCASFFRRKLQRLNRVVGNPSASVFDRKFNIFDPSPESRRMIDTLLMAIPFIGLIGMGLAFFVFVEILLNGLLLSAVFTVISLNLLFVDGASEVYHNATVFLNNQAKNMGFGEGDLKVLRIVKNALSWLSNYYFGLAVAFIILGLVLPSFVPLFITSLAWLMGGLLRAGPAFGFSAFATPVLWTVVIAALTLLIRAMKNRFSRSVFAYAA
jgi:hypothetical protein